MANKGKAEPATGTTLDRKLAPHRLKEGLVPPGTVIYLSVEEGVGAGRKFDVSAGGVYLIGREGADIVLDDEKISRKHADIGLYGPDAYILRDLASTNGTFVNGRRVSEKRKLEHWDLIRVGDTLLRVTMFHNAIPVTEMIPY